MMTSDNYTEPPCARYPEMMHDIPSVTLTRLRSLAAQVCPTCPVETRRYCRAGMDTDRHWLVRDGVTHRDYARQQRAAS